MEKTVKVTKPTVLQEAMLRAAKGEQLRRFHKGVQLDKNIDEFVSGKGE